MVGATEAMMVMVAKVDRTVVVREDEGAKGMEVLVNVVALTAEDMKVVVREGEGREVGKEETCTVDHSHCSLWPNHTVA